LLLKVIDYLALPLFRLLLLLGFSNLQLGISEFPELGKLYIFSLLCRLDFPLAVQLILSANLDLFLHVCPLLLLDRQLFSGLVLSLGHLLIKDLLFLVSELHELGNLFIN
jgi:hypothetical protein